MCSRLEGPWLQQRCLLQDILTAWRLRALRHLRVSHLACGNEWAQSTHGRAWGVHHTDNRHADGCRRALISGGRGRGSAAAAVAASPLSGGGNNGAPVELVAVRNEDGLLQCSFSRSGESFVQQHW